MGFGGWVRSNYYWNNKKVSFYFKLKNLESTVSKKKVLGVHTIPQGRNDFLKFFDQ